MTRLTTNMKQLHKHSRHYSGMILLACVALIGSACSGPQKTNGDVGDVAPPDLNVTREAPENIDEILLKAREAIKTDT